MPGALKLNNPSYRGKVAGEYLAPIVLSGKMINKKLVRPLLNVKNEMAVPAVKLNGIIKAYAAKFESSGEVDTSDRLVNPKLLTVNLDFDIDVIEQLFTSEQMVAGVNNSQFPADFEAFLIAYIIESVESEMDTIMWMSDKANGTGALKQINGFMSLMHDDNEVVKTNGVVFTRENIMEELAQFYTSMPTALSESEKCVIYCSAKTQKLYKQAIGLDGKVAMPNMIIDASKFLEENLTIESIVGFPNDTLVAASVHNLFFATDLLSDLQQYNLIDLRQTTGDNTLRLRMDFKADVNYGFGDQIALRTLAEAAPVEP